MSPADLAASPLRPAPSDVALAARRPTVSSAESYVEWAPIFAGAVLAAAISLVLFAFGGGVGLSIASPWPGAGATAGALSVLSVAWTLIVMLFSFVAGGYIAGRLRMPREDATAEEVDVRDGAHGLLSWATGLIIGAAVAMALALAGQISAAAALTSENPAMASYSADLLIRGSGEDRAELRAEIDPILAKAMATGDFSPEDRAYVAGLISGAAGISQADARARADAWATEARADADAARRLGAIAAFLIAATTLTSGAAAYFAAGVGGRHRDRNSAFPWTRARAAPAR